MCSNELIVCSDKLSHFLNRIYLSLKQSVAIQDRRYKGVLIFGIQIPNGV